MAFYPYMRVRGKERQVIGPFFYRRLNGCDHLRVSRAWIPFYSIVCSRRIQSIASHRSSNRNGFFIRCTWSITSNLSIP